MPVQSARLTVNTVSTDFIVEQKLANHEIDHVINKRDVKPVLSRRVSELQKDIDAYTNEAIVLITEMNEGKYSGRDLLVPFWHLGEIDEKVNDLEKELQNLKRFQETLDTETPDDWL